MTDWDERKAVANGWRYADLPQAETRFVPWPDHLCTFCHKVSWVLKSEDLVRQANRRIETATGCEIVPEGIRLCWACANGMIAMWFKSIEKQAVGKTGELELE